MTSEKNNFWHELKRPIKMLAPMAGYTDSAFRLLCREMGADVVTTELVSADAIYYHFKDWFRDEKGEWQSKKDRDETLQMIKFCEGERPILIQLFGKFPEKFAFASKWIKENLKPDGIDINMGCPARKVVNSDHGAALLKNPKLAAEIVRAVKENTNLPVSVKTRLGWDDDDQILEFAPVLWHAGIDAITIHGRTYKDGFKGKARWDNIYKVKELLPELVVVGNGDVEQLSIINDQVSFNDQLSISNMVNKESSLDGVAIGRATFGQPWIFSQESVSADELKKIILRHAELVYEIKGDFGLIEFRKHLLAYLKGFSGAKELRKQAVAVVNLNDVKAILDTL